mgnify:CR=1 FL=1
MAKADLKKKVVLDIPTTEEEKKKALQSAIAHITKVYGTGAIMRLGENKANLNVEAIPTGSMMLDMALGIGGGAAAFLAVWHLDLLPGYMRDRFLAVLDHSYQPDDAGFQQTRGLMALGSGELTGQGLFHGAQTQSSNVWSIPERQTDFIDIVAWRSTAEFVSKYFTKGSMAVVSGRLQIRDWTDREGGKRRSAEVIADNVYFGDSKPKDGGDVPAYEGEPGAGFGAPPSGFTPNFGEENGELPF